MLMTSESPKMTPVYERRALVLDDNEGNRTLIKFVLQMHRIELAEAGTAKAALSLWRPYTFAFAFLDIELPDFSGLEVANIMRRNDEGVAIIMCSTNDEPHTVRTAVAAGCDLFLVKPFQLDSLISLIKMMERAQLRAAARVLVIDNTSRYRWEARPIQKTIGNDGTLSPVEP
jgi:DNA-binding response OmpR family regulator